MNVRTVLAVIFLSSGAGARAATVTVPAPAADTMISGLDTTFNFGASFLGGGALGVDNGGGAPIRSLIRFNLPASIPANATITDAQMKLVVTRVGAGPGSNFRLHRLLKDWGEGNKSSTAGGAAATGEATWAAPRHPNPGWTSPGASSDSDRVAAVSSTIFVDSFATYTFPSTATLVADVQGWLTNPSSNFGWLIQSDGEGSPQSARRFGNREAAASDRPSLVITYTVPPPPEVRITQFQLTGAGMVLTWTGGSPGYRVERADNIKGPWTAVTPRSVDLTATAPLGTTDTTFYRVASELP